VRYEIVVRGLLSETLLAAFPTLSAEANGAETVLAGALADQAALYGVLAQIEALGLELLDVRRTHSCAKSHEPCDDGSPRSPRPFRRHRRAEE